MRGVTKAAASRLAKKGALTSAEETALLSQRSQGLLRLGDIEGKLRRAGAPLELAPTRLEQLRAGQRGMRWLGLPLRGVPGMAPLGEAYTKGLTRLGQGFAESGPGQALLKRFSHRHFIDESGRAVPLTAGLAGERFVNRLLKRTRKPEIARSMEAFGEAVPEGLDPVLFRELREKIDPLVRSPRSKGVSYSPLELTDELKQFVKDNPEALRLAYKARGITDEAFERMQAAGVNIKELMDPDIGYAERILTPEAFNALRKAGRLGEIETGMREIFGRPGAAIQRKYTGETVQALQDLFEKTGVKEFFELDPRKSLGKYLERESRARIGALHFGSVIESFGTDVKGLPGETMSALDFAKKGPIAVAKADEARLKNLFIPKEIAQESLRVAQKLSSVGQMEGLVKHWRAVASLYRLMMTAPFSSYHFRNLFSNLSLNWLAGVSNPVHYVRALRIQGVPWLGKKGDIAELEKLYSLGVIGKSFTETVKKEATEMGTALSPIYKHTVGTKFGGWLTSIGSWVEENARIAHYLGMQKKGLSDIAAADSVKKFLFNYDELTEFERYKLKNYVFFYTWTRNAVPLLLNQYFENTGKMAAMSRLATQPSTERDTLPRWMRQTIAIPAGQAPGGEQRYITGAGLPIEELTKFDLTGAKPGPYGLAQKALEKFAALLLPPLKAPLEMVTGRDFYLGKPIEEADRAPYATLAPYIPMPGHQLPAGLQKAMSFKEWKTPSGFTSYRADPQFLHFMRNLPTARIQNVISKLLDPRRDTKFKAISMISGLRTANIDTKLNELNAQIEAVNQELEKEELRGEAKKFRGYYAVGQEEEKSPRVKGLLQMLRQFQKERKEQLGRAQ